MRSRASNSTARRIVIFAAASAEELDIIGPAAVFSIANRIRSAGTQRYSVELVTSAPDRLIRGESGIILQAHRFYRELRGRIDTLLIAGGIGDHNPNRRQLAGQVLRLPRKDRISAPISVTCVSKAKWPVS